MSRDVYAEVTNAIMAAIEANPGDPIMPWHRGGAGEVPRNVASGNDYQGVNILHLWVVGQARGYTSNVWGTFNQWSDVGARVRKGERASVIVFYKAITKEAEDGTPEAFRVLKWFSVFNAGQVDGWVSPAPPPAPPLERLEAVERLVRESGAAVLEGGDRAFYSPASDRIQMPDPARFFGTASGTRSENFYTVLLHELTHWTGHPTRCARDLRNRFGSEAYAMEELVAELGAAFLSARLGLSPTPRPDHAQYVANWLAVLKNDSRAVFTAAARAQAAVDFLF